MHFGRDGTPVGIVEINQSLTATDGEGIQDLVFGEMDLLNLLVFVDEVQTEG